MDWQQLAFRIFEAVQGSAWRLVAALAVLGIVKAFRSGFVTKYLPSLKSGKAAFFAALGTGAAGAVANAYVAGFDITSAQAFVTLCLDGAVTGLVAAGLYSGGKKWLEVPPPPRKRK